MTRHNFSPSDKELLAKRVGYHCSNPSCGISTIGPSNIAEDSEYIGVAAHIFSASIENGPRANPSLTEEERCHINNGIHLCNKCSTLIDKNNGTGYPSSVLFDWKKQAEKIAKTRIYSNNPANIYKTVEFSNLEENYSTALSCTGLTEKNVLSCPINNTLLIEVQRKINLSNKCIITGKSGSGKSLLTYQIAYNFYKSGFTVFSLNKESINPFNFTIPCEKSIILIDDAQIIDSSSLEEILNSAYQNCLVLINWNLSTSTENNFLQSFPCVEISNKSQVKLLEEYCLKNKAQISERLSSIGLQINKKHHHDRIEARIKRAAYEATPWLFNYSLTEGWNTAKHDLDILNNNQKLNVVILTVAIYQLATLDKGVKESVILDQLQKFNNDNEWMIEASLIIQKYCFKIDNNIKNKHYEYSRRLLMLYLRQNNSSEEIDYIINLIETILQSNIYIKGHSDLLEFIMFDFRLGKYQLIKRGIINQIALNIFKTITIEDTSIINTLNSLIRFDNSLIRLLNDFPDTVPNWILQISRKSAFSLGNLLNTLVNEKVKNVTFSHQHIDKLFQKLFDASAEDKPRYSYLINRLQFFLSDELKQYEKQILITSNLPLNISSTSNDEVCYQFAQLIHDLAYINSEWANEQIDRNINNLGKLFNNNPINTYRSLKDLFDSYFGIIYAILGITIENKQMKKRAKALAKALNIDSIIQAFHNIEVIDVQDYNHILIFISLYNANNLKIISNKFDYEYLYYLYKDDSNLHHDHRGLIALLYSANNEKYQNYIKKVIEKYNYLNSFLIFRTPKFSIEKIKNHIPYQISIDGHIDYEDELTVFKMLSEEENAKDIIQKILQDNILAISKEIFSQSINIDDTREKLLFLSFIHSMSPEFFFKVFTDENKNRELIEKIKRLLKGKKFEKQHASLYIFLLKNYSYSHLTELHKLEKQYPSITKFNINLIS